MTDARETALARLREAFPEPFYVNLWPLTVESGRWSADALIVSPRETRIDFRAYADTPGVAADALIAAWREATAPMLTAERARADALAEALRQADILIRKRFSGDFSTPPSAMEVGEAVGAALAAHDAARHEREQATTHDVNAAIKRLQKEADRG